MATTEVPSKLSKYQRLEKMFAQVAEGWNETEIELGGEPGTRKVFLSMAETVLRQVFRQSAALPLNWRLGVQGIDGKPMGALYDGVRVLALYNHYASLAAGCQGIGIENLDAALRSGKSFEPLVEITELPSKIAGRVETEHGLDSATYDDGIDLIQQDRYAIERGAITMPLLKFEIARQRLIAGENLIGGGCRAHQAGQLEKIYQHFVTISLKDSRLAVASLARASKALTELN
jgi:hypothetical protein